MDNEQKSSTEFTEKLPFLEIRPALKSRLISDRKTTLKPKGNKTNLKQEPLSTENNVVSGFSHKKEVSENPQGSRLKFHNKEPFNNTSSRLTFQDSKPIQKTSSRLQFAESALKDNAEKPKRLQAEQPRITGKQQKKLDRLHFKAEKAEDKYFIAESKLPTTRKTRLRFDTDSGSGTTKLKFTGEEMIKAPKDKLRSIQKAKKLMYDSIKDNALTAVDGGEREQTVDERQNKTLISKGLETAKNVVLAPVEVPIKFSRFRNERKYSNYLKKENRAVKADTKYETTRLKFESQTEKPTLDRADITQQQPKTSSNPISKVMQKKRIQKEYRKKLKEQSKKVYKGAVTAVKDVLRTVKKHISKMGLICIIIFLLITALSACGNTIMQGFMSAMTGIAYSSYTTDEVEIEQADWHFSELELKLDEEIDNAEENYPDFDEYKYWLNGEETDKQALLDAIVHDPFELIAYLTVMFDDFKYEDIKYHIDTIFNEIFVLKFNEEVKTFTRDVLDEFGDPVLDDDGFPVTEEYQHKILNIELTVNDFEEVATPYMSGEKEDGGEHYDTLIETEGNHQSYGSPFNFFWHDYITSHYGGRKNPTGEGQDMHTGLDIRSPLGTPIYSVMEGKVTFAGWHNQYGNYVDIVDKHGDKSRYAHCSKLLVTVGQEVKRGEVIAEVGSTGNSTGNHLHIEIFQKGNRINPLFVIAREP